MAAAGSSVSVPILPFFFAALLIIGSCPLGSCWAAGDGKRLPPNQELSDPEQVFGIRIISLRPTAAGQMLDLRFQVFDPEKAKPVLDKNKKSYLVDQKSGKTLAVPVTKAGSMRQTTLKPEAGRVYFTLFANPGGFVKEDSLVTIVIGDFKKSNVIVNNSAVTPIRAEKPAAPKPAASGNP
jgi:hypothetical protein